MMTYFNESKSNINGCLILTQIVAEICSTKNHSRWTREQCSGLKIYPKELFNPIAPGNSSFYFDPRKLREVFRLTRNTALVRLPIDRDKEQIDVNNFHQTIIRKTCPQVYEDSRNAARWKCAEQFIQQTFYDGSLEKCQEELWPPQIMIR